ncbi:large ribosomal subunit protein eL34-like [Myotis daubentonii]|uniref:large ribosomal subunit protein eL34-like n=1 Tax=Myotis daubentonii TaxID=98922 RepID=UPI00287354AA|nr:large ribosomal subunit protein eL34-like [Myotis daubentonii]
MPLSFRQFRFLLTYGSDWCRMNFLVLFLTILGFTRGLTAATSVGSTEEERGTQNVQHLSYQWRLSYHTASNKTRLCRAPANRIVSLNTKKIGEAPKSACGMCLGRLRRVCAVRPKVLVRLSKMKKHVSRAWHESMCAKRVCDSIRKIVVKVVKVQAQSQKAK